MGFYGNITNTSRTQFQFDRVYSNRRVMDLSAESDGIYPGRYVLVNYEEQGASDYYVPAFKTITETGFQFGPVMDETGLTRFKWTQAPERPQDVQPTAPDVVREGQIIAIPPDHLHNVVNPSATEWEFWKCEGYIEINSVKYANFTQYMDMYSVNYNLDVVNYGTSRGYDSTVWQKTFEGGKDKYVMVAELNTVVPTFDIEADAPKMVPLMPHFDADSTNVYYKLHWSPPWGFRVKAAEPGLLGPILNDNGHIAGAGIVAMSTDNYRYPSDEVTNWYNTTYDGKHTTEEYIFTVNEDSTRGRWIPLAEDQREIDQNGLRESVIETPAAIYYNKAGFDPTKVSYGYRVINLTAATYKPYIYYKQVNGKYKVADDLTFNAQTTYYEKIEDHIQLKPSGRSGHTYNRHDGSVTDSIQEDTQELSIMLPAIGNTIAAVWDLIYGGEDVNGGVRRNLDISWEKARAGMDRHGLRLVTDFNGSSTGQYLYNTTEINTVAGAINSVHDLMGMIITSAPHQELINNMNALDENRIYYDEDTHTFNRKTLQYTYTNLPASSYTYETVVLTSDTYAPGAYFISQNGSYVIDNSANYSSSKTYYVRKINSSAFFTKVTEPFTLFDGTLYAYQDFTGIEENSYAFQTVSLNASTYRPNTYYIKVEGFYILDDTPNFRSGVTYYRQTTNIDPLKMDYVRDPVYYDDKTYYRWSNITTQAYSALSDVYEKNTFYYRNGQGDYVLAQDDSAKTNVQYYTLKETNVRKLSQLFADSANYGIYVPGKYLYKEGDNYKVDTSSNVTMGRQYWLLDTSQQTTIGNGVYARTVSFDKITLTADTYVKNTYYKYIGSGALPTHSSNENNFILCTEENFNTAESTNYYVKNETLTLINNNYYQVDSSKSYTLIQFHENEFFYKDTLGNYIALTRLSDVSELTGNVVVLRNQPNSGGTYVLNTSDYSNDTVSAMLYQDRFYEPGRYHYKANVIAGAAKDYSDYVLDTYPRKTHDTYYRITGIGNPVAFNFFKAYKYYSYNEVTDEYTLITDDSVLPTGDVYQRNAVYVVNDSANVYQQGAVWSYDTKYIPATLTLAHRTESYHLEPFVDFARNLNTMHGLLLRTTALLEEGNKDTRDLRTVQGALNTLSDKIAQFSTWKPGQILVADNYGRIHGATETENNWTKITITPNVVTPNIQIVHKFNPVTDTTHTTNLTTSTGTVSLTEVKPIVDATGHVVGKNTETYQLPFGYGKVQADSGTALAAGGSNATIKFEGTDNWIATAVATESNVQKVKITHEYTAGTNVTNTAVDLETNTDAKFTKEKPIIDSKGHVTAWSSTEYQLPHVYGSITTDDNNSLSASNTHASVTIGGLDNWIASSSTTTNNVQKVLIGHQDPVATNASAVGPTTSLTPAFGGSIQLTIPKIDSKGHIADTTTRTITIPQLSISPGTNITTNSVITNITYNDGVITTTSMNPEGLLLTGYTPNNNVTISTISSNDTIGSALNMLERRIMAAESSIGTTQNTLDNLDMAAVTVDTGEIISEIEQTNGTISVSTRSLLPEDIPSLKDKTFVYQEAIEENEEDQTTTVVDMATDLYELSSDVEQLSNSLTNLSNQSITCQVPRVIPLEDIEFWDSYDAWVESLNVNEDGYVAVEVLENDFVTNTYYIINSNYTPEDPESGDKYILADEYDSEATYYSSFTDLQASWLAENDTNNIYTPAGRPAATEPQTKTLEQILQLLLDLQDRVEALEA